MAYTPQNPNGQATMANSEPVVIASDQSAVPVSLASAPLPTGGATEATLASRLSESDFDSKVGSLTETAPGTDTASSGLNGRLQRIAQRITSLIALFPTSIGQKNTAGSLSVTLPSDQGTLTVAGAVTNTVLSVVGSGTEATAQRVTIATDSTGVLSVDDNGGSLTVDGTFWQATQPVSIASAVPVTDNSGSLTVDAPVATPVFVRLSDGGAPITTLPVSAASLPLPSGAATAAKQPALGTAGSASSDVITVQGIASGTPQPVSGNVAHAAVDSGNPIKLGAKAKSTMVGAGLTPVATDQRTDLYADLDGVLLIKPYAVGADLIRGSGSATVNTEQGPLGTFTAAAGTYNYITSIQVANNGTASPVITFREGPSGATVAVVACPPGGGGNISFPVPLRMAVNTGLYWIASAASTTVYVSAQGFKSEA